MAEMLDAIKQAEHEIADALVWLSQRLPTGVTVNAATVDVATYSGGKVFAAKISVGVHNG